MNPAWIVRRRRGGIPLNDGLDGKNLSIRLQIWRHFGYHMSKVVSTHLWNTPLNFYQQAIKGWPGVCSRVCAVICLEYVKKFRRSWAGGVFSQIGHLDFLEIDDEHLQRNATLSSLRRVTLCDILIWRENIYLELQGQPVFYGWMFGDFQPFSM